MANPEAQQILLHSLFAKVGDTVSPEGREEPILNLSEFEGVRTFFAVVRHRLSQGNVVPGDRVAMMSAAIELPGTLSPVGVNAFLLEPPICAVIPIRDPDPIRSPDRSGSN